MWNVDPLDYVPRMGQGREPEAQSTRVQSVGSQVPLTEAGVTARFREVFDTTSVGEVIHNYEIKTDPSVPPVAEAPRRVRVHVRDKLKDKLDELVGLGVITPVTAPTAWVSNLVLVDKPSGDIRLCLDPKGLNQAVRREHYQTPTLDEVTSRLSDAKVFFLLSTQAVRSGRLACPKPQLTSAASTPRLDDIGGNDYPMVYGQPLRCGSAPCTRSFVICVVSK